MNLVLLSPAPAGPLDNLNGLPAHPLIVHGALGLVLLASVGGVLSLVPRLRSWTLPTTTVVGVLAALSTLLATESGESLERRLPPSDLIEEHSESGERTRTVALLLAVLLIAWWAVDRALRRATATLDAGARPGVERRGGTDAPAGSGAALRTATRTAADTRTAPAGLRMGSLVLGVVTAAVSVLSAGLLFVTGEQGARAVWHDTPAASSAP